MCDKQIYNQFFKNVRQTNLQSVFLIKTNDKADLGGDKINLSYKFDFGILIWYYLGTTSNNKRTLPTTMFKRFLKCAANKFTISTSLELKILAAVPVHMLFLLIFTSLFSSSPKLKILAAVPVRNLFFNFYTLGIDSYDLCNTQIFPLLATRCRKLNISYILSLSPVDDFVQVFCVFVSKKVQKIDCLVYWVLTISSLLHLDGIILSHKGRRKV
jgi:hypothetical protein